MLNQHWPARGFMEHCMLEVRDLQLVYPNGYEALRSITLSVAPGEIAAIVGRSGAGKSTLLRCINGLERATAGSITVSGTEVTRLPARELAALRRRIGFVWQEYNLVDRLSVMQNVLTGRLGHSGGPASLLFHFGGADRALAVRALERVNMLHRARQRADRLSGGEKQRVAIARAIAQEPRVILADEPVASLDPELSIQVMELLARVAREEGVPALINLHAVDLAKAYCNRIVGIARGVVVFDGPPNALNDAALDAIYRFDAVEAVSTSPERRELAGASA